MTILEQIISNKRDELDMAKAARPLESFKDSPFYERTSYSLSSALRESPYGIIAEIKRRSPSKGAINEEADISLVAQGYHAAGISGISVLTDSRYFGGSLQDLETVRNCAPCPLLRKDFIIDTYQIHEAKAFGADTILLIAAALEASELETFASLAKELGLEVLFEIHSLEELQKCPLAFVDMIGVNNRDLKSFTVNPQRSVELASCIPDNTIKVSESGLSEPETLRVLKSYGYQGFLLGEAFMKASDPAAACRDFITRLRESF